jgi:hypothetical protein
VFPALPSRNGRKTQLEPSLTGPVTAIVGEEDGR